MSKADELDELKLQTCVTLFEAGRELSTMYNDEDTDLDWIEWLRITLPTTAIDGQDGVYNLFDLLLQSVRIEEHEKCNPARQAS